MRLPTFVAFASFSFVLAACTPAPVSPGTGSAATADTVPRGVAAASPVAAPPDPATMLGSPPLADVPAPETLTPPGGTYPGPFFLGRPDAPITIDEYADFQ